MSYSVFPITKFFLLQQSMITTESVHWKNQLLSAAKWLRSVKLSECSGSTTYFRVEKEIFLGFYSIRKLFDTYKVSDAAKAVAYELTWYRNTKPVSHLNWHKVDECYNLSTEHTETRDIRYLCNQFIHSYIFLIAGEFRIEGFFVASDRVRNVRVYFVPLSDVLHAFRVVACDCPSKVEFVRDPQTGELRAVHCSSA